ncbi:unnamed protein product, partial [Choristocarpus tenellus]
AEARTDFFLYARAWWDQFTSSSPGLGKRPVKIFAEDEQGQHRCVCSFVAPAPTHALRFLPTPRHAARFVSLLAYRQRSSVGQQRTEVWNTPHAFLASGGGECADHAILLCSLLLGFGLNAYVCIGEAKQG